MGLISELKRRNVFRVAVAYVVLSWLVLQMGDLLFDLMGLPGWALRLVLGILALGFLPALIFSWVYELTPEGLRKEREVDRSQSIAPRTGRRLDVTIVVMLAVAIGLFGADRLGLFGGRVIEDPAVVPVSPTVSDTVDSTSSGSDRVSIAVLPFANLSGDQSALPFTNGLHDDLLTQLARIDGLKVISRTSVMEYQGTTKNMRDIGEELGVSHLVEGGVQRAGDRVRINAQLIDSNTDQHLWAETFDRELTVENIFEIQSEIAGHITRALRINLAIDPIQRLGLPTQNLQAYEAYMRGRAGLDSSDYLVESLEAIRQDFLEAIRLDPEFAEAHARLALATDMVFWFGGRNTKMRELALQHARDALRIQPDLPLASQALASIYYHGYLDYDRALAELAKAEESLAGEVWPLITRGAVIRRSGDPGLGIEYFEAALELNPRGPLMHGDLIGSYQALGRYDDARTMARRMDHLAVPNYLSDYLLGQIDWNQSGDGRALVAAIDAHGSVHVDNVWVVLPLVISALWVERGDEAVLTYLTQLQAEGRTSTLSPIILSARYQAMSADLQAAVEGELSRYQARVLGGDQDPDLRLQIAEALTHLGRREEARGLLVNLLTDPIVTRDRFEGVWWIGRSAHLFALMGETEVAIDALSDTLSAHQGFSLRSLMGQPGMAVLEQHPRFSELVERFGWNRDDRSQGLVL